MAFVNDGDHSLMSQLVHSKSKRKFSNYLNLQVPVPHHLHATAFCAIPMQKYTVNEKRPFEFIYTVCKHN